ncbi:MAG: hypothetical protein CEE40_05785 [Chloroflexi bacterium B3_Chlor]|nr:MAG: hypothetical protein CEE40_05785 [Chloroflexi bacterium B3_Chlor]
MSPLQPTYNRLSLSVKYISVFLPFDIPGFLQVLREQGYFVTPSLEEATAAVPFGARLGASGLVARKADVGIRVDGDRQILGVVAPNASTALTEMDSLESLLKDGTGVDSPGLAQYYEFLASLTVRAKVSPLESWNRHLADVPLVQQASRLMGMKVSPFGLRLAPVRQVPNQPDWCEIRIEPQVQSPRDSHYLEIVFRGANRDKVFAFVSGFEETLDGLISLVEGE